MVTVTSLETLVRRALALVRPGHRAVVGITGSPGAGKSTLAEALVRAVAAEAAGPDGASLVAHVPMDGFHLADVELARLGRLSRKGAPDTFDADGYAALLERLRSTGPGAAPGSHAASEVVWAPAFERDLEQPVAGSVAVGPACRLVVTEGNYLLIDEPSWRRARACLDEVWFCSVDDAVRRRRLVARHVEFGKAPDAAERWVRDTDDPNARLVEACRERTDVLVELPPD
jgi:pantothenate kinase